jgi:hypothetical protein
MAVRLQVGFRSGVRRGGRQRCCDAERIAVRRPPANATATNRRICESFKGAGNRLASARYRAYCLSFSADFEFCGAILYHSTLSDGRKHTSTCTPE